jgi:hypothetical protein
MTRATKAGTVLVVAGVSAFVLGVGVVSDVSAQARGGRGGGAFSGGGGMVRGGGVSGGGFSSGGMSRGGGGNWSHGRWSGGPGYTRAWPGMSGGSPGKGHGPGYSHRAYPGKGHYSYRPGGYYPGRGFHGSGFYPHARGFFFKPFYKPFPLILAAPAFAFFVPPWPVFAPPPFYSYPYWPPFYPSSDPYPSWSLDVYGSGAWSGNAQPAAVSTVGRWVPGYWSWEWVPQTYTYQVLVPGHYNAAGVWMEGQYENRVVDNGYHRRVWVDGYWAQD